MVTLSLEIQLFASSTSTTYVPADILFKSSDVAEFDQLKVTPPVPPETEMSILPRSSPLHTEFTEVEFITSSIGSVIIAVSFTLHPFASVRVTI